MKDFSTSQDFSGQLRASISQAERKGPKRADPKPSFTPGPWDIDTDGEKLFVANGVMVVAMLAGNAEANAHLIAAAPRLLALAYQFAGECAECGGSGYMESLDESGNAGLPESCLFCKDIHAVINAATGEAS